MSIFPAHRVKIIEENLSKLKPLKYNRFKWWRRWDIPNRPLHKFFPLISKIRNGDLDFSHYFWQLKYCEYEINQKMESCSHPDKGLELTQIDRLRRKKLIEDFLKDEDEKLALIQTSFQREFGICKDTYYLELESFDGTLEEFYYYCFDKYKKVNKVYDKNIS